MKVNYKTTGVRTHFYKIDVNRMCIQVFKNTKVYETVKLPMKEINLNNVFQISYGMLTKNLNKKSKYLSDTHFFKNRKQFLSFMLDKRTIDLYFESEELLNDWVYGLITLIKKNNLKTGVFSVSGFILTRLKYNLILRLEEMRNDKRFGNKSTLILQELYNYFSSNSFGLYSFSFAKILLLYKKIMDKSPVIIN